MSKNNMVPSIRFKEFTNAWEQERFNLLFRFVCKKGFKNLPILAATKENGMQKRQDINFNVQFNLDNIIKYKLVEPGQFVIHLSSYDSGLAHSAILGVTSPAYSVVDFINKENNDDKFWTFILKSKSFIDKLSSISYGLRVGKSINLNELNNIQLKSTNLIEQNKISKLFSLLNSLITLHQRKLNALENLKKTLLEKMFPNENSVFPSIRFKEFTNAWEQERLGNLLNYIRPDNFYTRYDEIPESGKNPVLTANKSFILGYSNETNTFDKECIIFDDFTQDFKYVNFPFLVKSSAIKILINKNTMFDVYSLFLIMLSVKLENFGHARHYINFVQNKNIILCGFHEMKRIRAIFKHLNSIITLHQRKLNALENLKKTLLEKMFV
ncbi:restriction endonuclease subunit S [Mycoplasmopsis cynos]|uniref:restriction endonuclease subunit S n=1 Tax=Mycoplasmopsis cynos TaxID=171284 RepID=UPI002AFFB478|nr:restriction endonuclease subunit S [Mycoplasmopsis cynos]WQQ19149.1 restriction endonuclease subunit S [Mycoplasmopsis cynos]